MGDTNGTATKSKTKKVKKISLPVTFKTVNVNMGKAITSIGVRINRGESLSAGAIDELFTNAQLDTILKLNPSRVKDAEGQEVMEAGKVELSGLARCHGASLRHDHFSVTMKFSTDDVDVGELANFSGGNGFVTLARVGDADTHEDEAEE